MTPRPHGLARRDRSHNVFHHVGHISTLSQPKGRYNPGCYALLYDWLLPAEVFNEKDCPDDDLWPCREAAAHAPAFFRTPRLQWSAETYKGHALSPEKERVVQSFDTLPPLPQLLHGAAVGVAQEAPTRPAVDALAPAQRTVVTAKRGESCLDACARQPGGATARCSAAGLAALNACATLRAHFNGCPGGCEASEGGDQPALVAADAPFASRPSACLVNALPPTCEGSHPLTSRLCACDSPTT